MFKIKYTESKVTPKKKTIDLKNIAIRELVLVDLDTGEDITDDVIEEIPEGIDRVDFKLTFELPDEECSEE
jgi:hypothetical protein